MKRKRRSARKARTDSIFDSDVVLPSRPRGLEDVTRHAERSGWGSYNVKPGDIANFIKAFLHPHPEVLKKFNARKWLGIDLNRARKIQEDGGRNRGVGLAVRRRVVFDEFQKLRAAHTDRRIYGDYRLCALISALFSADADLPNEFKVGPLTIWRDLRAAKRRNLP